MAKRKRYDRRSKTAAVKVVIGQEKAGRELSEKPVIRDATLRFWADEHEEFEEDAFPGSEVIQYIR